MNFEWFPPSSIARLAAALAPGSGAGETRPQVWTSVAARRARRDFEEAPEWMNF